MIRLNECTDRLKFGYEPVIGKAKTGIEMDMILWSQKKK